MPSGWGALAWDPVQKQAWLFEPPHASPACTLWRWETEASRWNKQRNVSCDATYRSAVAFYDPKLKEVVVGFTDSEGMLTLESIGRARKRWTVKLPRTLYEESLIASAHAPPLGLVQVTVHGTWAIDEGKISRIADGADLTSIVWDEGERRLVGLDLQQAGTHVLTGRRWRRIAPHTRFTGSELGWDPGTQRVFQFVGAHDSNQMFLHELHGAEWKQRAPHLDATLISGGEVLAIDGGIILHGGQDFRLYGGRPSRHTWLCDQSSCEETVPPFVPPQTEEIDTAVAEVGGRVIHASLGLLEFHALGPEGWEEWSHGVSLVANEDAFAATDLGTRPLFTGGGVRHLTLLDAGGVLWQASSGEALRAVAPPSLEVKRWLEHVEEVLIHEEPMTGRVIAVGARAGPEGELEGSGWAWSSGEWKRFESPAMRALATADGALYGLTHDHRLVKLEGVTWSEVMRVKGNDAGALPRGLTHIGARFFTTSSDEALVALDAEGYQRVAALPCSGGGTLVHDRLGERLIYVCENGRGVYAMALLSSSDTRSARVGRNPNPRPQ